MSIDPAVGQVFKVYHHMNRAGFGQGRYFSDLVFLNGKPLIVVEWAQGPSGEVPAVTIELDPQWLQPTPTDPTQDYVYQFPVDDPRRLN